MPDAAGAGDDASQQEEVTDGIDRPGISGVQTADDTQLILSLFVKTSRNNEFFLVMKRPCNGFYVTGLTGCHTSCLTPCPI